MTRYGFEIIKVKKGVGGLPRQAVREGDERGEGEKTEKFGAFVRRSAFPAAS